MELLLAVLFVWLLVRAIGLAIRLTWGLARFVASILMAVALPAMILGFLFAGGIGMLVPILTVMLAIGVMRGRLF